MSPIPEAAGWNAAPVTHIVVHPKERRSKCTVEPLRGDPRFVFHRFPARPALQAAYVRLGMGGPVLTAADGACGLLILDGTWRWAAAMEALFAEVPVRTLPRLQTAYPRTSKLFDDPRGGLATVEAVYAALRILGRDAAGVLDGYRWGGEFLARNSAVFADLGSRVKSGASS